MTTPTPAGGAGYPYEPAAGSTTDPQGTATEDRSTTDTAREEGRRVAGVAREEASTVAEEAKTQARNVLGDVQREVSEQSRAQRDRLAGLLTELGDELHQMASSSDRSGLASDLAGQVADRSKQAGRFLADHEPGELVDEVRRFASRRPGVFLLGALAAGVAAGRLTRGAAKAHGVGEPDGAPQARPAGGYPTDPYPPVPTEPVGAEVPPDVGNYGGRAPTGPVVDPVEPGYPVPTGTRRSEGYAP
ncbi:MAG: hypothetical protein ACLGIV_16135 [Actinomycetes bacterium]